MKFLEACARAKTATLLTGWRRMQPPSAVVNCNSPCEVLACYELSLDIHRVGSVPPGDAPSRRLGWGRKQK
jgi:hypothetical protein